MRRLLIVLSLGLMVPAAASALAATPGHPVPIAVEELIAKRAALESYTPARMLIGFKYEHWQYVPGELRVWFANRVHVEVKFNVTPLLASSCAVGKQKTFQLAGNKVYWSQVTDPTVEYVQEAWRCVKHPSGRVMRLSVVSRTPPTKLADVGLGTVAASGRLIR
ncbi:MAG TPA: hypothetical protein VII51_00320 [Gaiellaceae bacterium]